MRNKAFVIVLAALSAAAIWLGSASEARALAGSAVDSGGGPSRTATQTAAVDTVLAGTEDLLVYCTAGGVKITLPAATTAGQKITITDTSGAIGTTAGSTLITSSALIAGYSTMALPRAGASLTVVSTGSTWGVSGDYFVAPSSLSSLTAWWEADWGVSASPVTAWTDRKNALSAAQGTGSRQPTWVASNDDGLREIRFDGNDDALTVADNAVYRTGTVFVMSVFRNTGGLRALVGYRDSSSPFWAWNLYPTSTTGIEARIGGASSTLTVPDTTYPILISYGTDTRQNYANGVFRSAPGGASVTYPSTPGLVIGGVSGGTETLAGAVRAVVLFNAVPTKTERRLIERYLTRWLPSVP